MIVYAQMSNQARKVWIKRCRALKILTIRHFLRSTWATLMNRRKKHHRNLKLSSVLWSLSPLLRLRRNWANHHLSFSVESSNGHRISSLRNLCRQRRENSGQTADTFRRSQSKMVKLSINNWMSSLLRKGGHPSREGMTPSRLPSLRSWAQANTQIEVTHGIAVSKRHLSRSSQNSCHKGSMFQGSQPLQVCVSSCSLQARL